MLIIARQKRYHSYALLPITIYISTTIFVALVAVCGFVGRSWVLRSAAGGCAVLALRGARVELAPARPLIGGVRSLRGHA
jgi:hypothetical protein